MNSRLCEYRKRKAQNDAQSAALENSWAGWNRLGAPSLRVSIYGGTSVFNDFGPFNIICFHQRRQFAWR